MHRHLFICLCLALTFACHEQGGEPHQQSTVPAVAPAESELSLHTDDDALIVSYARGSEATGPRVVELFIRHSEHLVFDSAVAGDAATAAGKELIVQERDAQTLRVLLFSSSNALSLDTGTLATLRMKRSSAAPAQAEILLGQPMFAPQTAEQGLRVSDPIEL